MTSKSHGQIKCN